VSRHSESCTAAKVRKVWEVAKKKWEKFGGNKENAYLCSVRISSDCLANPKREAKACPDDALRGE